MRRKVFLLFLLIGLVTLNLTGCATSKKQAAESESQQLQARVNNLELQLQQKDEEIQDLKSDIQDLKGGTKDSSGSKGTPRQIQTALKNAGYYNGTVDGKIGDKTKKAVKDFQAANGLNADGVVGKQTWTKLREYLYK